MSLQEFINKYSGVRNVGDTPENTGECVGLIEVWINELGQPHVWGNAKDLMANADRGAYDVIDNTPDNFPSPGDIVCWGGTWGGGFGHTGVVERADKHSMDVFQQNDPMGSTPHTKTYNYNGVMGWIHPKVLSNQGNNDVLDNPDDVKDLYLTLLGRPATDSEAQSWTGKTWHDVYYSIKDSSEGSAYRSRSAKVLADLTAQAQIQQTKIDELSAQLAKIKQTVVSTPSTAVTPPVVPVQQTEVDSTTNKPINTSDNSKVEPVKEGAKESTRLAILGVISFGVSYALENVVPGLPKNEVGLVLTVLLRGIDAYIHKNPKIKAQGLIPV